MKLNVGDKIYIHDGCIVDVKYGHGFFTIAHQKVLSKVVKVEEFKDGFLYRIKADNGMFLYSNEMIDWSKSKKRN